MPATLCLKIQGRLDEHCLPELKANQEVQQNRRMLQRVFSFLQMDVFREEDKYDS